jgi:hypothetical protein
MNKQLTHDEVKAAASAAMQQIDKLVKIIEAGGGKDLINPVVVEVYRASYALTWLNMAATAVSTTTAATAATTTATDGAYLAGIEAALEH